MIRIALFLINVVTAIMHVLFEIYIYRNYWGEYKSFILVENLLIAFMFLVMAIVVYFSSHNKTYILYNLISWTVFEISVLLLKPEKTTLELLNCPPGKQWICLCLVGAFTIIICIIEYTRKEKPKEDNMFELP